MWYQSTLEQQTPKGKLEQITPQSQRWSNKLLKKQRWSIKS